MPKLQPTFKCAHCHTVKSTNTDSVGTGYARKRNGHKVCYACCAILDRAYMIKHDKITLYLVLTPGKGYEVTNWPGTLRLSAYVKEGRHNIAGKRYDVWFSASGQKWYGVQYGDNTQLVHCRKNMIDPYDTVHNGLLCQCGRVFPLLHQLAKCQQTKAHRVRLIKSHEALYHLDPQTKCMCGSQHTYLLKLGGWKCCECGHIHFGKVTYTWIDGGKVCADCAEGRAN